MMPPRISTTTRIALFFWLSLLSSFLIVSPLDALPSPHRQQRTRRHGFLTSRSISINNKNSIGDGNSNGNSNENDDLKHRNGIPKARLQTLGGTRGRKNYSNSRFRFLTRMGSRNTHADGDDTERKYEPVEDDDEEFFGGGGSSGSDDGGRETQKNQKRLIEIKSEIELPFSAEVAYDAYSDLPRQASWSSWLESVEVVGNKNGNDGDGDDGSNNASKAESLWTSKMFGIRYSWTAVAVKNERPHTIRWRSVTGLRNEGIVRFYKKEGSAYNQGPTLMTLRMAFVAPRAVSAMIRRSKKLSNYVEEKMIAQSLEGFRDIVLEYDTKNDSNDDDKKINTDTYANDLQEATTSTAMSE